jgi:hypothetical protein
MTFGRRSAAFISHRRRVVDPLAVAVQARPVPGA